MLIGLEVLIVTFELPVLLAGLAIIPLVLLARLVAVGMPVMALKPFQEDTSHSILALTWGGLKGGISVALALALPAGPERDLILPMAYVVVVFSILFQGLTVKRFWDVRRQNNGLPVLTLFPVLFTLTNNSHNNEQQGNGYGFRQNPRCTL